jgi:hypothetical protein
MARTTIDLDARILRELKRRKQATGKSIGELASELLAGALAQPEPEPTQGVGMRWRSAKMGARVDLEDKEAVRRALDGS